MVDKDAPDHLRAQCQEMGPVLAADSTTVQKLQIRLIRQSRGFEALARLPPCEMFSRDPPEFRINNGNQSVQRFCAAVVPRRQHSGDVGVVFCRHSDRNPIKKDHRALTVPAPVRGIQSRNNFNRTKNGAFVWATRPNWNWKRSKNWKTKSSLGWLQTIMKGGPSWQEESG